MYSNKSKINFKTKFYDTIVNENERWYYNKSFPLLYIFIYLLVKKGVISVIHETK